MMLKKNIIFIIALLLPSVAFAAFGLGTDVFTVMLLFYGLMLQLQRLFWAVAIAFFIWGVVKFIANSEDSAEREKGKQYIVWAIIALVVLVSLWGIAQLILVETFGIISFGAPDFMDKNGLPVFP